MATPAAVLSILLEANTGKASTQLRGMQTQLQQTNRHATETEKASGKLGRTMGGLSAPTEKASRSLGGLAKAALAAGGAFVAFEAAKNAIESTVQLGEATIKLSAITGLDAKQASTWIQVMKARGVQTKQVSMAFITLSRQIEHASAGSKASVDAFTQLGIAAKTLPGKSTEENLLRVADGLSKLQNPAIRAASAQQLFGRGAQALIPVLAQGRAGVEAMLASAQRYGDFLPNNIKQSEAMIQTQFKLNYAMDGLKIAFTEAVLPVLVEGANKMLAFIGQMRNGTGAGGQFANAIKTAFTIVKNVVTTVVDAVGGLGNAVKILIAGFAISKIVTFSKALQGLFKVSSGAAVEQGMAGSLLSGAKLGVTKILRGATFAGIGVMLSQVVGSSIHGAAGSAVKAIGTDASIGAGLGSIFGPAGIAGGAILGGLVGTFSHFAKADGQAEGELFAKAFVAPLPKTIQNAFAPALAKAQQQVIQATHQAAFPANTPTGFQGGRGPNPRGGMFEQSAQQQEQLFAALRAEGRKAAEATVAGLKSVKIPVTGILTSDFMHQLQQLDPRARSSAAQVMLNYAAQLLASGKLPKDAVGKMIASMEAQFPALQVYLQQKGLKTGEDFAKAMRFSQATDQLKRTLEHFRTQFGDWEIQLNATTFTQLWQNMRTAMQHLKSVIENPDTLPAARKAAQAEIQHLRDQMNNIMRGAVGDFKSHLGDIKALLRDHDLHKAAGTAAQAFVNLQNAVAGSVSSGIISVNKGNQILAKALQQELSAFGSKDKIPAITAIGTASISAQAATTASKITSSFATGGLMQVGRKGAAGRDNVPMNVGGMPIMVGEGEQVAVFTRHQQKVANRALAPYGGLPGLFSKVNKPNYMATGGYVGNVVLDPGVNMTVGQEPQILADLRKLSAELQKTVYVISGYRSPAHSVAVGGFSNDPHTQGAAADIGVGSSLRDTMFGVTDQQLRAIGLYRPFYPASAAEVNHVQLLAGGAVGGAVGGAAGAAAAVWKNLVAPAVKGGGTIGSILSAYMGKATGAMNVWGRKHTAGAFGAGSFTGTLSGPVERQVYQFMSAAGFNKIAIAGMLGNAMQESSMNPNTPGGGLWQQISNFGSGTGGTLLQQMQTMLPQILGLRGSMNAAGSPGAAAVIFEQGFERAGVPAMANRISAANAAYAAGYSKGGLLPQAFGSGGLMSQVLASSGLASNWTGPRSRKTPPKPKGGTSIGLKQLAGKDMGPINKAMGELNNLNGDTGDIPKLVERYQAFDSLFQALHPNLQYLVQPADGSAPYIDDAAVQDSLKELLQLQAWEQQIIADYHRVQKLAPQVLKAIDTAIKVRRQAIEELKARIRANLQKIAALEKLITVAQKAKNTTLVAQYKKQVGVLKADNVTLGGSATSVGTTGRIGALNNEITALQDRSGKAGDMLVSAQGLTGAGGGLATENVNLIGLQAQIKPLQDWVTSKGGDLAVQLAATVQSTTSPATDPNLAAQLALQEQLTTQAQQALGVSQAQYSALQGLPFAGSFAAGGIVPGPVGAPAVAVVHGGEAIGQPGDFEIHHHYAPGMEFLRDLIRTEIIRKDRGTAGFARRALPGGGGGI